MKTAMDQESENRNSTTWTHDQLESLADHVANKHRPSKARVAAALKAIIRGTDWRYGRWP